MATVIVAGIDAESMGSAAAAIESLRHEVILVEDPLDIVMEVVMSDAGLVFLDECFPPYDAFQIADMLREDPDVPRDLPLIVMACDVPNAKRLYEAGITDYVLKVAATVTIQDMIVSYLADDAGVADFTKDDPVSFLKP